MYAITPSPFWVERRMQVKERERNIPAAILSIIVIATLSTALAQPKWFYLKGGGCTHEYIGVQEFFYMGYFESVKSTKMKDSDMYFIYHGYNDEMKYCVTPAIVNVIRTVIALCFIAILTTLVQFFFDTIGVRNKWLKTIRRNSLFNILTVLLCVVVIGLCFYISTLMEQQQKSTKINATTKVEIKFDVSYFLVSGAGAMAILAAAANLLRRYPIIESQSTQGLLDDADNTETFSIDFPHVSSTWPYRIESSQMQNLSAPPPYSP
ncbi:transmembrane protein 127-like [Centruroides vittatus]|uniref:transmembrane protein 127-like n=1 Tax=Centruroides vittatus TaxID=120091 RepID=UPI00350FAB52